MLKNLRYLYAEFAKESIKIKKLLFVVAVSFFLMLTSSCISESQKTTTIQKGVLDISSWDFTKNPTIKLAGETLFYWKQWPIQANGDFDLKLLKKADTIAGSSLLWTKIRDEKRGYGTLRLYLKREKIEETLLLEIPRAFAATEVWVNGKFVKAFGQISKNGENEEMDGRPLRVELPQESLLDISFLISNHKHRLGGGFPLLNTITEKNYFEKSQASKPLIEGIITFLILIFGIYQIIHYFSIRKYTYFLYLGLFCLIGGLRQLFVGEGLIYTFFPDISFDIVQKMRFVGYYGSLVSAFMYHALLFPGYFHKNLIRILVTLPLVGILYVLLAPTFYGTFSAPIFQVVGLVIICLGFYQIINAIRDKRPYAIGMMVSMSITCAVFINDLLNAMEIIQTEYLVYYGILFYVAFQIILNHRIQRKTEQKLMQLASDIQSMASSIDQKQKEIVQLRSETFQQLKSKEKLVENLKKVASNDDSISIQNIIASLKSELLGDSQLTRIKNDIETLNHEFAERIKKRHPNLTKTDIEICSYLRLSLDRKEIAKLRFTSIEAVRKSRHRLRKKINLPIESDLDTYIKSI